MIKGSVSLVDASKVGRPITIMVQVTIENERLDLLEEDKQRFVTCPQVQQVYYVTGDFDFLLVINVRDMAEYEALTRELFFASGNIKSFRTIVVDAKCEAGNDGHYRVSRVKVDMGAKERPGGVFISESTLPCAKSTCLMEDDR
ncbi:regulator for leucine (or lrp) regulon and high-affinity branched-chain amino acid transport system [Klebsiella pneumoniae]|uniref:Regulator for leucine (Or lrp) regulon and high-affinity branched-chain amino acid transport system n=1 Tax=Klebsiella pneumoniae TaxID=573 RepID=A0A447S4U5_KLEPN|nr:regulator for leucine (or lrp) regulon and high-affinity branched-chain amino acid transport system [Klebsiella pneumoniae]